MYTCMGMGHDHVSDPVLCVRKSDTNSLLCFGSFLWQTRLLQLPLLEAGQWEVGPVGTVVVCDTGIGRECAIVKE